MNAIFIIQLDKHKMHSRKEFLTVIPKNSVDLRKNSESWQRCCKVHSREFIAKTDFISITKLHNDKIHSYKQFLTILKYSVIYGKFGNLLQN